MKFTLIAAISILSTIASGLALPDLSRREKVIRPSIGFVVRDDFPNAPSLPTRMVQASRKNGAHTVKTFFRFLVPACTGTCTISFSDAIAATGSRKLQLFTTIGNPPLTDTHKGNFLVSATGVGPATVVDDFGLTFPCRATTTTLGYEVKPFGDNDYVIWDITKGGFIITCG